MQLDYLDPQPQKKMKKKKQKKKLNNFKAKKIISLQK